VKRAVISAVDMLKDNLVHALVMVDKCPCGMNFGRAIYLELNELSEATYVLSAVNVLEARVEL